MRVFSIMPGLSELGRREIITITVLSILVGLILATAASPWWLLPVGVLWAGGLAFFRDPERTIRPGEELLSAADGRITDVTILEKDTYHKTESLRIGIFLSIFNVHINRVPCTGVVRAITFSPGRYLNAMRADAGEKNASCTLSLDTDFLDQPVIVRQISGAIARRIVCNTTIGSILERGQRFGMIKFGSRTEIIVPAPQPGTAGSWPRASCDACQDSQPRALPFYSNAVTPPGVAGSGPSESQAPAPGKASERRANSQGAPEGAFRVAGARGSDCRIPSSQDAPPYSKAVAPQWQVLVQVGQTVRAGVTPVLRYAPQSEDVPADM